MKGCCYERGNSHDSDSIVVKNRRDILRRKFVGRVADQQAGLADSTVADDNAPRKKNVVSKVLSPRCVHRQTIKLEAGV